MKSPRVSQNYVDTLGCFKCRSGSTPRIADPWLLKVHHCTDHYAMIPSWCKWKGAQTQTKFNTHTEYLIYTNKKWSWVKKIRKWSYTQINWTKDNIPKLNINSVAHWNSYTQRQFSYYIWIHKCIFRIARQWGAHSTSTHMK